MLWLCVKWLLQVQCKFVFEKIPWNEGKMVSSVGDGKSSMEYGLLNHWIWNVPLIDSNTNTWPPRGLFVLKWHEVNPNLEFSFRTNQSITPSPPIPTPPPPKNSRDTYYFILFVHAGWMWGALDRWWLFPLARSYKDTLNGKKFEPTRSLSLLLCYHQSYIHLSCSINTCMYISLQMILIFSFFLVVPYHVFTVI